MKPTDKELISKLLSLPEPALAELLAMVGGIPDRAGQATAAAVALPGWAMGAGEGAGTFPRPGGRA